MASTPSVRCTSITSRTPPRLPRSSQPSSPSACSSPSCSGGQETSGWWPSFTASATPISKERASPEAGRHPGRRGRHPRRNVTKPAGGASSQQEGVAMNPGKGRRKQVSSAIGSWSAMAVLSALAIAPPSPAPAAEARRPNLQGSWSFNAYLTAQIAQHQQEDKRGEGSPGGARGPGRRGGEGGGGGGGGSGGGRR